MSSEEEMGRNELCFYLLFFINLYQMALTLALILILMMDHIQLLYPTNYF